METEIQERARGYREGEIKKWGHPLDSKGGGGGGYASKGEPLHYL